MARETVNAGTGWTADDEEIDLDAAENTDDGTETDAETAETGAEADEDQGDQDDEDAPKGRSREAKYRQRAKDAEKRAQALSERVERMQRAEAERLAGGRLADGGDLWRYDAELSAFLDSDGEIDAEALAAHVDELLTKRPHLAKVKRRPMPDRSQGAGKGAGKATSTSWADVIPG